MLRRMTMLLVAAVAFSPLVVPVVEAADPIKDAVALGAARLESLQNSDGGWCFQVAVPCVPPSPQNTFGVTAQGLLDANALTPTPLLLTAAKESGDNLKARVTPVVTCGFDTGGGDTPMRTSDVVFLQNLGQVTGNQTYKTAANAFFNCVVSEFPAGSPPSSTNRGIARANNRIDRRQLGAWDAAFDILAALKTGSPANTDFAKGELTRVLQREADWSFGSPGDCTGVTTSYVGTCDLITELLGKAHLLQAMVSLQNSTPFIKSKVTQYLNDLAAAQQLTGNGSFDPSGDTQLTAYAVLGLDPYASSAAQKLVVKTAADFLLARQLTNGGFETELGGGIASENTEVDSEVLQALNAAH